MIPPGDSIKGTFFFVPPSWRSLGILGSLNHLKKVTSRIAIQMSFLLWWNLAVKCFEKLHSSLKKGVDKDTKDLSGPQLKLRHLEMMLPARNYIIYRIACFFVRGIFFEFTCSSVLSCCFFPWWSTCWLPCPEFTQFYWLDSWFTPVF